MQSKRSFKIYSWIVTGIGAGICLVSAYRLPVSRLGLPFVLLGLVTVTVGSRIMVRFFRFDSCISISDIFVFLALLVFGPEAAILIGSAESLYASRRITKKPLTMAFNAAAMACSTFVTALALHIGFGGAQDLFLGPYSSKLIVAICVMGLVQFAVNSGVVAVGAALRSGQPIWPTYKKHYVWTSITYFAGASAAGAIAKLGNIVGIYAFIAVVPIIAIVYFTYVTYLKNVASSTAQAESEKRFHRAFDNAPIGMALAAPDGRWLQVNGSLCNIVGYTEQEMLGLNFQAITHPEDLPRFMAEVSRVLDCQALTAQMEKRYVHKAGHEVWGMVGVSLLTDGQSETPHLIFQIQDITDRKRAEGQLLYEASHDTLTGLPNRAWFMEQLETALQRVKQDDTHHIAVLFLDLDRFKVINDSIGHLIGDQLLIGIAERLRQCLRPDDKVARLGGDEFTILLNGIRGADDASEVADRVQKALARPFSLAGHETFTTASIGIAISEVGYDKPEDLLRDADTAMYQAKSLGNAQHVVFDKSMHARAMVLLQLETDLRRAIDKGDLFIEYQPIVSLDTLTLTGFEALVRWNHPDHGLIAPDKFIPIAEETGLIVPLGNWMLHEACTQMRLWQRRLPRELPLYMSVNLSSKQFKQSNLITTITRTLDNTGLDPRMLKLEITESVVMENIEVATRMLEALRDLGVEMSIDDFGTGYSSLSYLHRLPIDTLKIDRSFISRMTENNENREIIRTIIMLARNLEMAVVAEGVETKEQIRLLRELECESAQGYVFSMPINSGLAEQMIQRISAGEPAIPWADEASPLDIVVPLASIYQM
jgi:diguanylate cyclase (GGDEF)-like protein/PAS domain S-box-containing protein